MVLKPELNEQRAEAWLGDRLQTGGGVGGGFWAAVDRVLEQDRRSAAQGGAPSCQRALDGAL